MSRKILLRFDDICPTMDWKQWKKAVDIMKKNNIKPLIGIVPDCKDPDLQLMDSRDDFWEYVKELQDNGYTIAMHGYKHVFDIKHKGLVNYRLDSEFAGHSYENQCSKIKRGKEILNKHGIETDIFFAPAHSYDKITLKALADCNFKYVVDGKSKKTVVREGVRCIPCRDAGVPHIHRKGTYIAIFHAHEWSRKEKYGEYRKFLELCEHPDICSFEDIRNDSVGNLFIQILDEILFMWYDKNIRPLLSTCKRKVFRIFKHQKINVD